MNGKICHVITTFYPQAGKGPVHPTAAYTRIQRHVAVIAENLRHDKRKVNRQQIEDLRVQIRELLNQASGGQDG